MVLFEELNAYNSFNAVIDFEDGRFSLCRLPKWGYSLTICASS